MKQIQKMKEEKAITLIALVITIVVMLILAGVIINLILGENGIFTTAQQAAKNYTDAQNKEMAALEDFVEQLETVTDFENQEKYNSTLKVNRPQLLTGMTAIKFTTPTESAEGIVQKTNESDLNWYNYDQKKWANVQTEDGSMWVWIPRYAYKINKSTQTTDVVFLIGTTDKYYDENGEIQIAQRATATNLALNTEEKYTVHPAFTNESTINYANGGWDKELTGIWVAKFEAGYASGNNTARVEASGVNYTEKTASVPEVEAGTAQITTARNWLDGEYAEYNSETKTYEWKNGVETAIKYPTFQGITYGMNYINHNDAYNISRALTSANNIYGLSASTTDSHLMKNSEWGAVAYLSKSKYGLNATNIYINNISLNSHETTPSVYAVTGCCTSTNNPDEGEINPTIAEINSREANGVYVWTQKDGQRASTTGTIYGIYDISGGGVERIAGYVANANESLITYGESIAYDLKGNLKTVSTKYTTVYPHDSSIDYIGTSANSGECLQANYTVNRNIFGDAIRETSTQGTENTSWYNDYSNFVGRTYTFFVNGGSLSDTSKAGVTAFFRTNGRSGSKGSFRAVLVENN